MTDRRTVLAVVMAGLLVVTAGCSGALPGTGDGGASGTAALDSVPAEADAVFFADVDGILASDAHRSIADAFFDELGNSSESYEGPTSVEEALEEARNTSDVDPAAVGDVTVFSSSNASGEYSGAISETNLSTEAFVAAQERTAGFNYTETEYNGHALFVPEEEPAFGTATYIGVLADGTFVTGTEAAVRDSIDTVEGDMEAFSGPARDAFEDTRSGFVRFASAVPQEQVPTNGTAGGTPVDVSVFAAVSVVSGSQYVDGETVGLAVNMETGSADEARDVRDVTDGAVSFASGLVSEEVAKEQLREVEVTRDGSTVGVTYENTVAAIQEVVRTYVRVFLATGVSG